MTKINNAHDPVEEKEEKAIIYICMKIQLACLHDSSLVKGIIVFGTLNY